MLLAHRCCLLIVAPLSPLSHQASFETHAAPFRPACLLPQTACGGGGRWRWPLPTRPSLRRCCSAWRHCCRRRASGGLALVHMGAPIWGLRPSPLACRCRAQPACCYFLAVLRRALEAARRATMGGGSGSWVTHGGLCASPLTSVLLCACCTCPHFVSSCLHSVASTPPGAITAPGFCRQLLPLVLLYFQLSTLVSLPHPPHHFTGPCCCAARPARRRSGRCTACARSWRAGQKQRSNSRQGDASVESLSAVARQRLLLFVPVQHDVHDCSTGVLCYRTWSDRSLWAEGAC